MSRKILVDLLIGELEMEKKTKENLETENNKLYDELTEEVTQEKLRADELISETESLKNWKGTTRLTRTGRICQK